MSVPEEKPLQPPSVAEIEAEAQRCRTILNELPPNYYSDEMYAAYNTLLFVLGYGVQLPSVLWGPEYAAKAEQDDKD